MEVSFRGIHVIDKRKRDVRFWSVPSDRSLSLFRSFGVRPLTTFTASKTFHSVAPIQKNTGPWLLFPYLTLPHSLFPHFSPFLLPTSFNYYYSLINFKSPSSSYLSSANFCSLSNSQIPPPLLSPSLLLHPLLPNSILWSSSGILASSPSIHFFPASRVTCSSPLNPPNPSLTVNINKYLINCY